MKLFILEYICVLSDILLNHCLVNLQVNAESKENVPEASVNTRRRGGTRTKLPSGSESRLKLPNSGQWPSGLKLGLGIASQACELADWLMVVSAYADRKNRTPSHFCDHILPMTMFATMGMKPRAKPQLGRHLSCLFLCHSCRIL